MGTEQRGVFSGNGIIVLTLFSVLFRIGYGGEEGLGLAGMWSKAAGYQLLGAIQRGAGATCEMA